MKRILELFFWSLASLVVALVGLGLSTHRTATPADAWELFSFISPADGWIQPGSSIAPLHLASRGNRMYLQFNPWRPPGIEPAHLRVSVCGNTATEFVVTDQREHLVYLTGDCNPRLVRFEVLNPFRPSVNDQRELGAQLTGMRITSRIGFPLVSPGLVLAWAAALFTLVMLLRAALPELASAAGGTALLAWSYLLANSKYVNSAKALPLWLVLAACAVGVILYRRARIGTEPVTPDAGNSSLQWTLLALSAVAVGGALRFANLGFGFPANFHPDEVPKVNAVMRMVHQNTLDPQYFLHPTLLLYSTYFMNWLIQSFGFPGEFEQTVFLGGRVVSALAGTISIYFTYAIGSRLFGRQTGVAGAFLLAVFPLHVTCSRYLKEDALLTAFVLASVLAVLKAVQEDRKSFLLLAGLLAGCSSAVKYSGMLSACILLGAPWLRSRSWKPDWSYAKWTVGAVFLMPLGFFICTPYSVLNAQRFLRDVRSERDHMLRGHTATITAWSQYWMYHIGRSIAPGASVLVTVLAAIGTAILLLRRRIEDLYLVALFLLFYLPAEYVKAKPAPQPERYILPCLPFVALLAAELFRLLRGVRPRALVPALFAVAVMVPAVRSVQLTSEIDRDTRDRMAAWMLTNIPRGSKVLVDWKPYSPRFFNDEFDVIYLPRDNITAHLTAEALQRSEGEYLLLSSLWYDRYFSQPRGDMYAKRRIRGVFENFPIVKHVQARYGTYGFHNPALTLFSLGEMEYAELRDGSGILPPGRHQLR